MLTFNSKRKILDLVNKNKFIIFMQHLMETNSTTWTVSQKIVSPWSAVYITGKNTISAFFIFFLLCFLFWSLIFNLVPKNLIIMIKSRLLSLFLLTTIELTQPILFIMTLWIDYNVISKKQNYLHIMKITFKYDIWKIP